MYATHHALCCYIQSNLHPDERKGCLQESQNKAKDGVDDTEPDIRQP
jgi:hypothetical protein